MEQSLIYNLDIFWRITEYLTTKELLGLQLLSQKIRKNVNEKLKLILLRNGLLNQLDIPPNILYRSYYGRESYFWQFDEQIKPFKRKHIQGYPTKEIKVGLTFTAFLTFTDQLYISQTSEFTDSIQKPKQIIKNNVKQFNVNTKGMLWYLTYDGYLYAYANNQDILIAKDVYTFQCSYAAAILIFNQQQQIQQISDLYCQGVFIYLYESTFENLFNQNRWRRITGIQDDEQIISLCIGSQQFYLLTQTQKVYSSEFLIFKQNDIIQEQTLKVQPVQFFNNKHIISLNSGFQYYVALGREEQKCIKDWSNDELVNWLNDNGLSDYTKLVKYHEYTGAEFQQLAQDKTFLKDNLGLEREDLLIKLSTELSNVQQSNYKECILYGWGKNDAGQLAIGLTNNAQYQKLPLPQFEPYDEIQQVACGWANLAILTQQGRIYLTENLQKQQKKEKAQVEEAEKQEKEQGNKRKKSKDSQPKEEKKLWNEITRVFIKPNDKRQYINYYINLSREYLVTNFICLDKKLKLDYFTQTIQYATKDSKKFKPSDQIINRILWDPIFKKEEFTVGYEDRFLGIMEITLSDFVLSPDKKMHRIQYFKKNQKIVWDRVKKIDLF